MNQTPWKASCAILLLLALCPRVGYAAETDEPEPVAQHGSAPTSDSEPVDKTETLEKTENGSAAETDAPWHQGASPEEQKKARALFQEANALVRESVFVAAVDKYELALESWDHPRIHYNLALALLNLDQPLRLRAHLLGALRYEGLALGEEKKLQAEQYLHLVEKQLTFLSVKCRQRGARVMLDGELLFQAPGEYEGFLRPGPHILRATAPGYEPTERSLTLLPGNSEESVLKLYTANDWQEYRRRWAVWGPIAVTASGALIAASGGGLYWWGGKKIRDSDERVDEQCPEGCSEDDVEISIRGGKTMQGFGIGAMAAGGAVTALGTVLLYMNRQIAYRVDPEQKSDLSFTPLVGPGFSGLVTTGTF